MYVTTLHLRHYRNYQDLSVSFSPSLNVVYGDNGQGKTNLLESLYFLATGKSHRTARDADLLSHGTNELLARARIARPAGELDVLVTYSLDKRKQLILNGSPEKRIASLVGKLRAVFFSPDDLQLVKGPPVGRRRFLDIELSQISTTYLHHLLVFNRVLSQRNALLKQMLERGRDETLLGTWDEQLVGAGAELIVRRLRAVLRLRHLAAAYHARITEGREQLDLRYASTDARLGSLPAASPPLEQVREYLQHSLQRQRAEELRRGQTLIGPHRDDLVILVDGNDARAYASQGQQRTAVLSLKLAELQFMREQTNEAPILLLDDVLSELDPSRRHYLLQAVEQGVQTFVSCTDLESLMLRSWPPDSRLYRVTGGRLEAQPAERLLPHQPRDS